MLLVVLLLLVLNEIFLPLTHFFCVWLERRSSYSTISDAIHGKVWLLWIVPTSILDRIFHLNWLPVGPRADDVWRSCFMYRLDFPCRPYSVQLLFEVHINSFVSIPCELANTPRPNEDSHDVMYADPALVSLSILRMHAPLG